MRGRNCERQPRRRLHQRVTLVARSRGARTPVGTPAAHRATLVPQSSGHGTRNEPLAPRGRTLAAHREAHLSPPPHSPRPATRLQRTRRTCRAPRSTLAKHAALGAAAKHLPRIAKHTCQARPHLPRAAKHVPRTAKHTCEVPPHLPRAAKHLPRTARHLPRTATHSPRAAELTPRTRTPPLRRSSSSE